MAITNETDIIHGLVAEFDDPNALVKATELAHRDGYRRMDAYSPFPIEELHHALGAPASKLPLIVFVGGLIGCLGGFALESWANAVAYPLNVAGKPFIAWPMFIPVTFECTILGASLSAVFGMLALNRLPQPYHPIFNHARFATVSTDRFFLCIEAQDPKFHLDRTRAFLQTLGPREVTTVED
ncbi:MAG: DUF3341 domain-containing protein [Vicinamibacterales bacterium]